MSGAAFFDLDRTILLGPSGPLISDALVAAGIAPERNVPGAGLLSEFYRAFGESIPFMVLARAAALATKGWAVSEVAVAAEQAVDTLEARVAPYARSLIAQHHAEGRAVIIASTTPEHLVRPLAERLGVDDVIATRYAVDDGAYTGGLDGDFVWSRGKVRAVRRWASTHQIDLSDAYAYSDSIYDLFLLNAVGHPFAVNPDPRLRLFALARRWPMLWLDVPPGVPKFAGHEPVDVVRLLSRPEFFPYARFVVDGDEHIPRSGPVILVANHRSYFDMSAMSLLTARVGRSPRFLAKKELFDAPVIGPAVKAVGGICVDRGSGSGRPLEEAERVLAAGDLLALMPQGTIPRGPAFFASKLQGRPGAARLAAASGAPVIPVGLWGTEQVWPRSGRLPYVANVLHPPQVSIRVGPAVEGLTGDEGDDTVRIMAAIAALLPAAARRRRKPTAAELRRTYPPGHSG